VLDRLGVSERLLDLPHSQLAGVEFVGIFGRPLRVPLQPSSRGEIAMKRSLLDQLLLTRAGELGTEIRSGSSVTAVTHGWQVTCGAQTFSSRYLVAADGRNSTVARLLQLLPPAHKDRLGLQTHLPTSVDFGERVSMRFLPQGYCGIASVGDDQLNLCLVSTAALMPELKSWATAHFQLPPDQPWRSIAPLARAPLPPVHGNLLLIGDTARVVEPFTGEGIYYALASGALAAEHLQRGDLPGYAAAHARLYRGRLWVNQLAKLAVLHPLITSALLQIARHRLELLRFLTQKVVGAAALSRAKKPAVSDRK
jgi:flavin-dependent dehydrogenase